MPIYEYLCENGHRFESFQSMSEDPISVCPECGAKSERQLSAPAIHYKGSGFYTTDYARKGKKTPSGGGESGSSGDSNGSSSSDSGSKSSESSSGKSSDSGSGSGSSGSSSSSSD
jgi:putative FmdB family regulatory protein